MKKVKRNMTTEDEILFQYYKINGYTTGNDEE